MALLCDGRSGHSVVQVIAMATLSASPIACIQHAGVFSRLACGHRDGVRWGAVAPAVAGLGHAEHAPKHQADPLVATPQVTSSPTETSANSKAPATSTGTAELAVPPLPSWPDPPRPLHIHNTKARW